MSIERDVSSAKRAARKLLILGSGFGGVYALGRLVGLLKDQELDITMISEENLFVFSPLLHEVATGASSPATSPSPSANCPTPRSSLSSTHRWNTSTWRDAAS